MPRATRRFDVRMHSVRVVALADRNVQVSVAHKSAEVGQPWKTRERCQLAVSK